MGVLLSSNMVKLYLPSTGQCCGVCRGHTDSINHISFSRPLSPHLIVSSLSEVGTPEALKRSHALVLVHLKRSSASPLEVQILFWDWRNKKQVACLVDCHGDDVTQVLFAPHRPNKLISASLDGLICSFDTAGDINDDDNLESVINVGTSVGKVGIFGETFEKVWCLTQIETLSVWNRKEGTNRAYFQDARSSASDSWNQGHVGYFVDCHSSGSDSLWVIGGTDAGTLGYFPVNYKGNASINSPEVILSSGHTGVVRSVLPMSTMSGPNAKEDIFGWTGGEDVAYVAGFRTILLMRVGLGCPGRFLPSCQKSTTRRIDINLTNKTAINFGCAITCRLCVNFSNRSHEPILPVASLLVKPLLP